MPKSQLKLLKSSLRDSGVTGPQRSKKQKQKDSKNGRNRERAISRADALDEIRGRFNPFEVKTSARGPKREFATTAKPKSSVLGRPGVTKGYGEELRRKQLLGEMRQRHKVGGINDRRFGENDPTMAPEDRAHERFIRERQRGGKKSGLFDLEADDDVDGFGGLTHLGNPLAFSRSPVVDDYDESDIASSEEDADMQANKRASKRQKLLEDIERLQERGDHDEDSKQRKSKQEVMKEVMAKSKLHKYERQQAKEDDEDLRAELDANLKDVFALMRGQSLATDKQQWHMNDDRAAMIQGRGREDADRRYDLDLKAMTHEARGKPSNRTKTDEEIAEEEAQHLKELEEKRLRRMNGEENSSDDEAAGTNDRDRSLSRPAIDDDEEDEFGLGTGVSRRPPRTDLDVEDEDEFELDNDLIASGSELDLDSSDAEDSEDDSASSGEEHGAEDNMNDDDDADFLKDLITPADSGRKDLEAQASSGGKGHHKDLAFTFPCPESHEEFLSITKGNTSLELVTIIQRIRALHSPKLDGSNKVRLATFGGVLVDHLLYLGNIRPPASFTVIGQVIRHVHSLAKAYPIEVAVAFRKQLIYISKERPLALNAGDLILLTAIGTIFSTSDQFHQVVTLAMLVMARYLGQSNPQNLGEIAKGAYICGQFLFYQRLSKRYIPEVVTYTMMALESLAPVAPKKPLGQTPHRTLSNDLRITEAQKSTRPTDFWDIEFSSSHITPEAAVLKQALLGNFTLLVSDMSELWRSRSAYIEIMTPPSNALAHLLSQKCSKFFASDLQRSIQSVQTKTSRLIAQAAVDRRPLRLHNYRPLPIKTYVPKFEDDFNPDRKSHDPDRERAAAAKLRAEHKKERKGALRELRKDANFVARETLRQKKEADAEYEKKYKRLVAEIQGEEGREAKAYEREKRWRQGKK